MQHRIKMITSKKLVGKHMTMSFTDDKTGELWKSFMQQRREIANNTNQELISMQVYPPEFFADFHPATKFEKWAAIEVNSLEQVSG